MDAPAPAASREPSRRPLGGAPAQTMNPAAPSASSGATSARHPSRPHSHRRPASSGRWPAGVVALLALVAGLYAAFNYPIAPYAAASIFVVLSALAFRFPMGWLVLLFALLPIVGFAPWTGWITFEEADLLVLAAAAGGYWRLAVRGPTRAPDQRRGRAGSVIVWLLLLLFAASIIVAMLRGFADAGGFQFGWFQSYHEPMNSVRLAKSFFLALLLLGLWLENERQPSAEEAAPTHQDVAARWLTTGLALGLATVSLAAVWERVAFTGLLNASTDYRTTALFWEMHVGGAALDGFLALTVPFALAALLVARGARDWAIGAAALALGGYACLTTFSRGVYLAIPIGAVITLALYWRQVRRHAPRAAPPDMAAGSAILLVLLFGVAAFSMFPGSGWRGLMALLGVAAVWLAQASALGRLKAAEWAIGVVLGLMLAGAASAVALLLPKGPYLVFALALTATAALAGWRLHRHRVAPRTPTRVGPLLLAGLVTTAAAMAGVAYEWGGEPALTSSLAVLGGLALLTAVAGRFGCPRVPPSLRWRGSLLCAMLLVGGVVGIVAGGDYMSGRFSTSSSDLEGRREHWSAGLAQLYTPADWWLGKGLGRFPASNYFATRGHEHPGDWRLITEGANRFIRLTGGDYSISWGDLLRISQRVPAPALPAQVRARVRSAKDVSLHFEVCEKQLLYNGACASREIRVKGLPGQWQTLLVPLAGKPFPGGAWWAPPLVAFSFGVAEAREFAEVDDIALIDAHGRNLIENGDFSRDMAHWFFTSDRMHLPWHIKSMAMNVLFDQGAVGLALFSLLLIGALWRVMLGSARDHPLAPSAGGALAGFWVVGLFDSLLDAPRVALVFYFILLVALTIRPRRPV